MRSTVAVVRAVRLGAMAVCLLSGIGPVMADPPVPEILDVARLKKLAPKMQSYEDFLIYSHNRAVAISESGGIGNSFWGQATIEDATSKALDACNKRSEGPCRLYAVNNDLVYDGKPVSPPPAIAAYGELKSQPTYFWYGPQTAKGAIVWSHGNNGQADDSKGPTPVYVRFFSNAGWDVYRFDRDPRYDTLDWATNHLIEGIGLLKKAGYKRVISAGQSRGGFHSINALYRGGLIDGVIATAPAAHGTWQQGGRVASQGLDDFRSILKDEASPQTRVVIAFFDEDPYDPDPAARGRLAQEILGRKGNPLMLIQQPAGFKGHGSGNGIDFARKFGRCVLKFFDEPPPAGPTCS